MSVVSAIASSVGAAPWILASSSSAHAANVCSAPSSFWKNDYLGLLSLVSSMCSFYLVGCAGPAGCGGGGVNDGVSVLDVSLSVRRSACASRAAESSAYGLAGLIRPEANRRVIQEIQNSISARMQARVCALIVSSLNLAESPRGLR